MDRNGKALAPSVKRFYLVFDQGDKRGDNHGKAGQQHGRKLVNQ
jgi:hypothetical protein